MKHLSKLAAILAALVLACAFFGCSDGSDGDQSISLSDGDYTLKIKQSVDGMVEEDEIKATASNNILTFNSGSVTVTKELTAEELKGFEAMSEEEKKAEIKGIMESPDDAEISFDGNKVIIKANLSAAELAEKGYMVVTGKVSRKFFEERFYGMNTTANQQKGEQ